MNKILKLLPSNNRALSLTFKQCAKTESKSFLSLDTHYLPINTPSSMSMTSWVPFQLSGHDSERNRFEILGGPGDSRVTGSQIVEDEDLLNSWSDKVILVTGVSSGIGVGIYPRNKGRACRWNTSINDLRR